MKVNLDQIISEKRKCWARSLEPVEEEAAMRLKCWLNISEEIPKACRDMFAEEVVGLVGTWLAEDDRHPGNTHKASDLANLEKALRNMDNYVFNDLIIEVGISLLNDGIVEREKGDSSEDIEYYLAGVVMERLKIGARKLRRESLTEAKQKHIGKLDQARAIDFIKGMVVTYNSFAGEKLTNSERHTAFTKLIDEMLPIIDYESTTGNTRKLIRNAISALE